MNCLDDETELEVLNILGEDETNAKTVLDTIEKVVVITQNLAVKRLKFRRLKQQKGEKIKDYHLKLKSLAIGCKF